ncbi:hypothetical protein ABW21_db0203351 [Orbilia brochopaga]|nr:hypothetical protein ABW21_db0203351 [Drechslerella brochopaga]
MSAVVPDEDAEPFSVITSLLYWPSFAGDANNTAVCGRECMYYMLPYHRDRLVEAARNFGWFDVVLNLNQPYAPQKMEEILEDAGSRLLANLLAREPDLLFSAIKLRMRIAIQQDGSITITASRITGSPPSVPFPNGLLTPEDARATTPSTPWPVYIDTAPTTPSLFTRYKTNSRDHYTYARTRVGILTNSEPAEVLLWSDRYLNLIMEGSMTNVYFYRNGRWITPTTIREDATGGTGGCSGTVRRWLLEKGYVDVGDISKDDVIVGELVWLSNGVKGVFLGMIAEPVSLSHATIMIPA